MRKQERAALGDRLEVLPRIFEKSGQYGGERVGEI
jgi:hypothetical protein